MHQKRDAASLAASLFEEFQQSEDMIAINQAFANRFPKYFEYFDISLKRIGKQTVFKYLDIYKDLAGIYEKQLRLLYGLK